MIKTWKPKTNGFFINDFKEKLKKKNFLPEDIKNIVNNSADALSKTIDPKNPTLNNETFRTNLVLGYIQSGKTTSMEAVSCMARDNGFKLMIILSGNVSNLADQTQDRVYKSLDQFGWNRVEVNNKMDYSKTSEILKQLVDTDKSLFVEEDEKPSMLMVTKKTWKAVENVTKIFEKGIENNIDLSKIPTIIFDDEADHYSLDGYTRTKKKEFKKFNEAQKYIVEEGETLETLSIKFKVSIDTLKYLNFLESDENKEVEVGQEILIEKPETTTHRKIKRLRQLLTQHSYLGYTATPVANFLIAKVNNLSPQSATILEPGSLYTGAKYFFGNIKNKNDHIKIIEEKNIDELQVKPDSLTEAIKVFLIGVAQGLLDGDHKKKKTRSMLIHPSVKIKLHQTWHDWVKGELQRYKKAFDSKGRNILDKKSRIDIDYHELEKDFIKAHKNLNQTEKKLKPWNEEFIKRMVRAIDIVLPEITLFNRSDNKPIPFIQWGEDSVYARILVGGIGLERGYTIGGLTVSYITRETGTDDIIYQRARFFGYHKPYIGFVRMYLPSVLTDNFSKQQENEIIVREKIKEIVDKNGDLRKELKRSFPFAGKTGPVRNNIIANSLKKFPFGGIISDHRAHQLDDYRLEVNKKIFDELCGLEKKIKFKEFSDHTYAKNLDKLDVINNLSLFEISNKYLKELNYYNEGDEDDYSIITDLCDWQQYQNHKDLEAAIVIMNGDGGGNRSVNLDEFKNKTSSIPIESGANQSRPGHAYLHYEFMNNPQPKWRPDQNTPYSTPIDGIKNIKSEQIATIQLYKFKIWDNKNDTKPLIEDVPYFRIYIPKKLGKGFKEVID